MLVDVAQRDITPRRVGQDGAGQRRVAADHDVLLRAVAGLVDAEVAGQDGGDVGLLPRLCRERLDIVDHGALEQAIQLGQAFALHLIFADQRRAQWVGRGGDLERLPAAADDLEHLFPVAHGDVGHIERAEDVDAGVALGDRGQIMVAHEHDHRDAGVRDLLDAAGELTLVGRVGIARFVRIAGEDEDIHALFDGIIAMSFSLRRKSMTRALIPVAGSIRP